MTGWQLPVPHQVAGSLLIFRNSGKLRKKGNAGAKELVVIDLESKDGWTLWLTEVL